MFIPPAGAAKAALPVAKGATKGASAGGGLFIPGVAATAGKAAASQETPKENALIKALNFISKPKSAIVAGAAELGDFAAGRGFSVKDIRENIGRNYGVADVLKESGITGPGAAVAGFVGDVVLDPTTYLGGAGLAKKGAQSVARQLIDPAVIAKLGAKNITPQMAEEAASTVLSAGYARVNPKVLEALGEVTGKTAAPGIYFAGKAKLPGTEKLATAMSDANVAIRRKVVASKTGQRLMDKFVTDPELKVRMREGDLSAFQQLEGSREVTRQTRLLENKMTRDARQILQPLRRDKAKYAAVRRSLEGNKEALAALHLADPDTARAVSEMRRWFDEAADSVGIPRLENYFPRSWTPELRAELRASLKSGNKEVGPAMKRMLVEGEEFMGETLRGTPDDIRQQIEDILKREHPDDYIQMFDDDFERVLEGYTRSIARKHAQKVARDEVFKRGLVKPVVRGGAGAAPSRRAPAFTGKAAGKGTAGEQGAMDLASVGSVTDVTDRAAVATMGQADVAAARSRAAVAGKDIKSWRAGMQALDREINMLEDHLAKLMRKGTDYSDPAIEQRITELYRQKEVLHRRIEITKALNATDMDDAMAKFEQNMLDFDHAAGAQRRPAVVVSDEAARLFDVADLQPDPKLATVARLQAQAEELAARIGRPVDEAKIRLTLEQSPMFKNVVKDALRSMIPQSQVDDMVDALTRVSRLDTPEGLNGFLKLYDDVNGFLKRYMILTPGFHFRNHMGGTFNNWLAGVERSSNRAWGKIWVKSKFGADPDRLSAAERQIYDQVQSTGMVGNTQAREMASGTGPKNINPFSKNFALTRGSRNVGDMIEGQLRGALAYDTIVRQRQSVEEATAQIAKFHFDYEDLTAFESGVMRRIIPFYTWTRKNLPLQLEQMVKQPGKYTAYTKVKDNIESLSDPEEVVPGYYSDLMGIRMPFKMGEGTAYWMPDLPFREVGEWVRPDDPARGASMVIGGVTPLLKVPVERWAGKQYFNDIPFYEGWSPAPGNWNKIPGLMQALNVLGMAEKGADGRYYMDQRNMYTTEQLLPIAARVRRLFPSGEGDEHLAERQMTSVISTIGGVGLRANTPAAQKSELRRRQKASKAAFDKQKDLGY